MGGFKKTKDQDLKFYIEVKWHENRTKQTLLNKITTAETFL